MPGLGGQKWTKQHAEDTSYVINKIEPEYLRLRTLEIFPLTKLKKKQEAGKFTELSEEEIVKEERRLVENINCNTTITSDSAANLLIDVWGELPKDKNKILKIIDNYLDLDKEEKIEFSLKRRLEAYKSQYGGLSQVIQKKYNRLQELSDKGKLYQQEAQKLIKFIRSRLIP
jgi:radical SAM superfamily enzyme